MISRRTMLAQSAVSVAAVSAAAVALHSTADAATPKQRRFTLDLRCGSIGVGADQREAVHLAGKYGFESVTPIPTYLHQLSGTERKMLAVEMQQRDLVWGAAGLPVDIRKDASEYRQQLKQLPELAESMQQCGVTRVGTWISPSHNELTYRENFRRHIRRYQQCATILKDHGLRLGLEYIGPKTLWSRQKYPFIHTMKETKDLIEQIGTGNVGFVLDSWHWYTAHESAEDLLTLTNEDVVACDLNDAPLGREIDEQIDNERELPTATSVIDLKAFLQALVAIGYDGPVRAEPFNQKLNEMGDEEAVAATAKAMKKAFSLVSVEA